MIAFYCPACWAETGEGETACPHCAADVRGVLEGRDHVAKLIAALRHPEPNTPIRAAKALGALRAAEAVGPLLELARRPPDPFIQAAAVEALGRIGAPEARATMTLASTSAGTGPGADWQPRAKASKGTSRRTMQTFPCNAFAGRVGCIGRAGEAG